MTHHWQIRSRWSKVSIMKWMRRIGLAELASLERVPKPSSEQESRMKWLRSEEQRLSDDIFRWSLQASICGDEYVCATSYRRNK